METKEQPGKVNNGVDAGGLFEEQLDQFYLIMPECVYLHRHQVCEQIIRLVPRPGGDSPYTSWMAVVCVCV